MRPGIPAALSILLLVFAGNADVARADTAQKAVLITGASSGIGRLTTERLAEAGYFVYAGARKQGDIDDLNTIDNVMAVRLDVTVQAEIDAAVDLIRSEGRGLWGLVNNAGVNHIDPLIEFEDWTMDFVFDVNVFGVVRVTKAFAPLIIESRGRIVNISSISGVLAGGLTGYGFYFMSKHAIEAFSDQLAWELSKFDVRVAAVEPGNFRTRIGTTRCRRMLDERDDRSYQYFGEEMDEYYDGCDEWLESGAESDAPPPVMVADAIQHALFAEQPKEHYLVVADPFEARITIGKLIEELVHMNEGHDQTYDRDELIEMLDGEEARYRGEIPPGMPGIYE
jgi:NAD(P)-dependent dehydrogenase (short-subunit alcohol dehydrogenase family)